MEDIFTVEKLFLFILFFVPGFISMKVYHLLIASENTKFSESFGEAIGFSSINFASLSWLIILIYKTNFYNTHLFWCLILCTFIIFIAPILWTILFVWIAKSKVLRKYILSPIKNPWDFYFEKRESCWVVINLKDSEKIGGIYSENSFSSAFPHKAQIYLEELWDIDEYGNFLKRKSRTNGIIIFCEDIKSIEFYK